MYISHEKVKTFKYLASLLQVRIITRQKLNINLKQKFHVVVQSTDCVFSSDRKHLLATLLSLEFVVLILYISLYYYLFLIILSYILEWVFSIFLCLLEFLNNLKVKIYKTVLLPIIL